MRSSYGCIPRRELNIMCPLANYVPTRLEDQQENTATNRVTLTDMTEMLIRVHTSVIRLRSSYSWFSRLGLNIVYPLAKYVSISFALGTSAVLLLPSMPMYRKAAKGLQRS